MQPVSAFGVGDLGLKDEGLGFGGLGFRLWSLKSGAEG